MVGGGTVVLWRFETDWAWNTLRTLLVNMLVHVHCLSKISHDNNKKSGTTDDTNNHILGRVTLMTLCVHFLSILATCISMLFCQHCIKQYLSCNLQMETAKCRFYKQYIYDFFNVCLSKKKHYVKKAMRRVAENATVFWDNPAGNRDERCSTSADENRFRFVSTGLFRARPISSRLKPKRI